MRERVEDLGRIAEISASLMDHEAFTILETGRTKDLADKILSLDEEKRFDQVNSLIYSLRDIQEVVSKIWGIARYGEDADAL